ncbi:MAG TPA: Crp/Fnr family transcriptional regulator [Terriglobales bacterium]|jgi:CRP/FNR family transcriptional regulator, cyclic AMP receptor protein|nr:Crp/Fnr family transcriptional regulator [Terriglobales bacterium]
MSSPYGLQITENCLICKLRQSGFFCDLPRPSLEALEKIKYASAFPQGAVLFVEGQAPRGIYLICSGRVKLSTTSRDGKTLILRIAESGEVLGLHATVSGKPYELTAETLQPCQLDFIRREDFLKFLQNHADACLNAAQHLSKNCQDAYEMIRSLGLSHSVSEKLARLLLEWSTDGDTTPEGIRIKVALTHEEIAQLIGTSRETVTRVLGEFREKKVAQLRGSTLVIQDRAALERLVGS